MQATPEQPQIPFGEWVEQGVTWIERHLGTALDVVSWPFDRLADLATGDGTSLLSVPWLVIVAVFLGLTASRRRWSVAVPATVGLSIVPLLGVDYDTEALATVGLMAASLGLSALFGVPIGLLLRRTRPLPIGRSAVFVHPLALMVPLIFLFGIGSAPILMLVTALAAPTFARVFANGHGPAAALRESLWVVALLVPFAAIMGGGGLGGDLFRAMTGLDIARAGASGLAIGLIVGVFHAATGPADRAPAGRPSIDRSLTGVGRLVALGGGLLAAASVLLVWNTDGGAASAYVRRADLLLPGQSFNGIDVAGGSWFGIVVLVGAAVTGVGALLRSTTLVVGGGCAVAAASAAFMVLPAAPGAVGYGLGIGAAAALAGGLLSLGASFAGRDGLAGGHPRKAQIGWAALALALAIVGGASSWVVDQRSDQSSNPELQAEIQALEEQVANDPETAGEVARQIAELVASASDASETSTAGVGAEGVRLGLVVIVLGLGGAAALVAAALGVEKTWLVSAGLGAGILAVSAAWILSLGREADVGAFSGGGAFLALLAGTGLAIGSLRTTPGSNDVTTGSPA